MIEVQGADRLAATATAAGQQLAALDHSRVGDIITRAAQSSAPRRTGALAASHRVQGDTAGGVTVVALAPYATPVHQGWAGHAGRPWLATAAQATETTWVAVLEAETQTVLDTITGA